MLENWENAIITDINLAIYVAPHTGKAVHHNRPFHGFVMNDDKASKVIHFSDGTSIHSGPNEVHYLPKGSNYRVETIISGGCWAINFDLLEDIEEAPFSLPFRNHEGILKLFKDVADIWKTQSSTRNIFIRKSIYELIIEIQKERLRSYLPSKTELLIQPALDAIARDFTKNDLSVKEMARLCQISEVYFRRIFKERFSVTPKEYIIALRMEYAKKLLQSKQVGVGEVAELCGYFEPCHFSREFSKHTGVSPKAYSRITKTEL